MNGKPVENKKKKSVEMKDNKSTHSVIESMDIINKYKGNNSLALQTNLVYFNIVIT